ncbi:MAG: FHA domain-containing protein [Propionibacteriaceae bacterium]|jgi:S-DNA-T family DNA segregation ATPase FtsK/SpoIIIE|nr:FHA domain-containing protein [Propionibacteriaceae bacterium]
MKLKLTVKRGQELNDLMVTADGTAVVGDIAAALAFAGPEEPKQPDGIDKTVQIPDGLGGLRILSPATPILDSGIRSGMVVNVIDAPDYTDSTSSAPAAILRVVAGVDTGLEAPLPFGSSTIGRGMDATVQLRDPLVSKVHARLVIGQDVEIIDNNSANGVIVGDQPVGRIRVSGDDVVTLGDTSFTVTLLQGASNVNRTSTDIAFVRQPNVLPRVVANEIELPSAPGPLQKSRFPLLAMAAPLMMGVVMYIMMKDNANFRWLSMIFVAMSPIMMIGNWIDQRIRNKRKQKDDIAAFKEDIVYVREQLAAAHYRDRENLLRIYPSQLEMCESAARLGHILWWRRSEHPDYLKLRLGIGTIPAYTTAERAGGNVGLVEYERQLDEAEADFAELTDAPVVVNLRDCGSLGLAGPGEFLDGLALGVVTQLICMHSPADLVLTCLTSVGSLTKWRWLQWLPHTSSPHSPLGDLHLAADPATGAVLLSHLEELVASRGAKGEPTPRGPENKTEEEGDKPLLPTVIVLVDGATVDRARLTRIAERGPDVGVHMVWCEPTKELLPGACRTFLEAGPQGTRVGKVRQGLIYTPVIPEPIDQRIADQLGRVLAPVLDAGVPVEDASDLPKAVTLVTLTGQEVADDPQAVVSRWRENQSIIDRTPGAVPKPLRNSVRLRAVVGHAGTDVFTLDLRTQGPHALVGGTTGAGKSEFLQAWVLGMATAHSPDRVSFLFVDYKGGSAFSRCLDLPHTVGLVTDLSPYLVRRALTSLRAELRHREHLLNEKSAKDLVELEKRGDPDCPPSLIIVVDEFAALVGEVPEFVDGVVDVAQRGRSLGLHLILATQRPAGVIKDNLRANTNLRVALRMADEHDSTDVLGEKTAAYFDPGTPGRGAAKTGPGRVAQFQSGYPGAKTPKTAIAAPVDIAEMSFGIGRPWQVPKPQTNLDDLDTDIDRLVASISAAAKAASIPAPRKPWLEGLALTYDLTKLPQRRDTELVLGVIDDPDNQAQRVEFFQPDHEGNIAYYGAGGSGKTTALRSLALAASITPRSGSVHIYGVDFAGGGLGLLDPLPNVGSIIGGDDDERVARLFRWLRATADERAARYSMAKAPTLGEYRRATGKADEPRIMVLVDGYAAFKTSYESTTDKAAIFGLFQQLLVDGRGVGIHFAVTADRPAAINTSVGAAFQRKVVLRQTDEDGYRFFSLPKDVLDPSSPPGRALQVGMAQELQLAILGDNINMAAQSRTIEELAEFRKTLNEPEPYRIQSLGTEIPAAEMPEQIDGKPVLGVSDTTLAPISFDPVGAFLVAGPVQSGRTNTLKWFATSLRSWRPKIPIVHLSPKRSPLSELELWSMSATGMDACEKLLERLKPLVSEENPMDEPQLAVLVESYPEFLSSKVENLLTEVVKGCKANSHLFIAEGEFTTWNSSWPLLMEVRNTRTGLLLQADSSDGDSLLRTSLPRFRKADPPPGRGWWVHAGKARQLQIPLVD